MVKIIINELECANASKMFTEQVNKLNKKKPKQLGHIH